MIDYPPPVRNFPGTTVWLNRLDQGEPTEKRVCDDSPGFQWDTPGGSNPFSTLKTIGAAGVLLAITAIYALVLSQ